MRKPDFIMDLRTQELVVMMYAIASKPLPKVEPTPDQVLHAVASALYLLPEDIKSKSRERSLTDARFISAHLICSYCDLTLVQIGAFLGGRDHTTIINAKNQVEILKGNNVVFLAKLLTAERKLAALL